MSRERSFHIFASLVVAVAGLGLIVSGCSSEQVSQKEKKKSSETKKQQAAVPKPQGEISTGEVTKDDVVEKEPAGSNNDAKAKPSDGDTAEKTAENEDGKSDDPPKSPKNSDDSQPADPPKETEPAETKPIETAPKDGPKAAGERPKDRAEGSPSNTANPFAPAAELDVDGLVQFILDRINERELIRRQSGFTESVIEAADRIIASDTSSSNKSTALLAKFKILHEASLAAEAGADEKLFQLAEQQQDNTGRKASAFVRFVNMERRLLEAQGLEEAQSLALLDELKTYLAKEKLSNRQLRMAMRTVEIIRSLGKQKQEPLFEQLGLLYAKSSDLDLKKFGLRLGKPPEVNVDRLAGQLLQLSGTTTSGDKFEWAAYRGDVVIVDFWATWCGPCIREIPGLLDLYEKHAGDGLEIVGVSLDANEQQLKAFLASNGIQWVTIAGDEAQQVAERYGVRAIPTAFLIGRDGKIIDRSHRIEDLLEHLGAALAVKREKVKPKGEAKADAGKKDDAK